jgi:hypothetical protein
LLTVRQARAPGPRATCGDERAARKRDDAEIESGMHADEGGRRSFTVGAASGMDRVAIVAFYDAQLSARGWTVDQRIDGGNGATYALTGHGYEGVLIVSETDTGVALMITLVAED